MGNDYDTWLKKNAPAGGPWKARLLPLAAAGLATILVGLSVVLMAGVGLPPGEQPLEALAPAAAPAQTVRYAEALPTVTVVGRRQPAPAATAALPAIPASGEAATVGMTIAGDNLRQ